MVPDSVKADAADQSAEILLSGVKGGVAKRQIYYHGSEVVGKCKEDEYQRHL